MARRREFFPCPHCGEPVRAGAGFCRACGSDKETGWSNEADDAGGTSESGWSEKEDDFDYQEYLAREFPDDAPPPSIRSRLTRGVAWLAVLAVILAILWFW